MPNRQTSLLRNTVIICLFGSTIPCGCGQPAAISNVAITATTQPVPRIAVNILIIDQPNGQHLHCSIENHSDQQILLGDKIFASWELQSRLAGHGQVYESGHWDLPSLRQSHYAILQPIPASRLNTSLRIDTEQLRWDLSLDAMKEELDVAKSGRLTVSIYVFCSTDLYPRPFSVDVGLDLPLVAGGGMAKEFVLDDKPTSATYVPTTAGTTATGGTGVAGPSSGPSIDDILAELRAKQDKEMGTK